MRRTDDSVAETVLSSVEELAVLACHELRDPVSVIHASARMLRDDPVSDVSRQRHLGGMIVRQVEALQRLANVLSTVALPVDRTATADVATVLRGAVSEVADDGGAPAIRVRVASSAPALIDGDLLRVVLVNVLANAWKHRLADSRVDVVVRAEVASVSVAVANESPPIPVAARGRVFDPFFRLAGEPPVCGMGLGLFLVRLLVERHEGVVTFDVVDEEPARVTVTVVLPAAV